MLKKTYLIIVLMLFSLQSFAQLTLSPAPISGEIDLNSTSATINISNTSTTPISLSLSLLQTGFSMGIDRCSGKTLSKNQSCYFVISVNDSLLPQAINIANLKNNGNSLVNLKRTKIQALGSSLFGQSSVNFSDFLSKSITIQNKTSSTKSYVPVLSGADSSKFEILLNRCSNVGVGQTCSISVRLKPQMEGSYSASLSEPQISSPVSLSSTISGSTSGVIIPLIESMSISPSSLNFGTLTTFAISTAQNITISNTGTLTISPIISVSSKMAIVMNRCSSLPPGKSCSLSVAMKPLSSDTNGSLSGSVSIQSSMLSSVQSVSASSNLSVPPAYLTGSSQGGTCSSSQHFEGAICVSNIRSCESSSLTAIIVGGNQNWSGSSWGSCIPQQASHCASGYVYSSNQCNPATYDVALWNSGSQSGDNILASWEGNSFIRFTISVRTEITDVSFKTGQNGTSGSIGFMIFDNYSPTAGLGSGDPLIPPLGVTELKPITSFGGIGSGSIVNFLFNQSPVILDPGTYYLGFNKIFSGGALWIPIFCGSPYAFIDTQNQPSPSACVPHFQIRGVIVP